MFSGWKSILVQNGIKGSKWAKGSQNVKNNLIGHLRPFESKRSFQATFSDEIGRWEVSKPSYVLLLRLKVKLKVKIVSSFSFQLFSGYPSVHVLYFA